ncbi:hypothetical protein N7455_006813 [Penicillium solitum]|uniref:uncharacterized protein n=1 Tax=Penicillium solitum TaxID=60172 RepID=UPI0018564D42|nr:hypothetical protein HAV15_009579 [Penicillium sp. str. \
MIDSGPPDNKKLRSLLPACYRTELDDLVPPSVGDITCVEKELDLQRLSHIFDWLWVAGRPMPPRPLHYQLLLNREIFVTERMDMHLVWTTGRIFLKPIPRFLLEPCFWKTYLSCDKTCKSMQGCSKECKSQSLRKRAIGFLFSYTALILHESDYYIARDKHLLPSGGLNKIYYFSRRPLLRGYMANWNQYGTFFQDNFGWLASATVYVAIVLAAMQVDLATKALANNDTFQSASHRFTVFSILGPLAASGLIILFFCYFFVDNWVVTLAYRKRRLRSIQDRLLPRQEEL